MQTQSNTTPKMGAVPYRLRPKTHGLVAAALANKQKVFDLVAEFGSPLNLIFPQVFRENYTAFATALQVEQVQHRVYCTCKPNRSDAFLREVANLGAYVDVSSLGEFEAARNAGIIGAKISATGPKNKPYMDAVLQDQALSVVDNWHELHYLSHNAQGTQPVMVRLSSPQEGGPAQDDTFGFHFADVPSLITYMLQHPKLAFHGFACHYSGGFDAVRLRHIELALQATLKALACGLMPKAVNIGGGYQVGYVQSNTEWQNFMTALKQAVIGQGESITWDNAGMGLRLQNGSLTGSANFMDHYQSTTGADHLKKILNTPFAALEGATLIDFLRDSALALYIEPGRALADQCGVTLAEVNFTKKSAKGHWLINLDMHHANLNAHAFKYMAEPFVLHRKEGLSANTEGVFYYGSLCFASDLITFHKTYPDHLPQSGDVVAFANTAGYRMDFAESEMLRHPNAKKVCLTLENNQWHHILDTHYQLGNAQ